MALAHYWPMDVPGIANLIGPNLVPGGIDLGLEGANLTILDESESRHGLARRMPSGARMVTEHPPHLAQFAEILAGEVTFNLWWRNRTNGNGTDNYAQGIFGIDFAAGTEVLSLFLDGKNQPQIALTTRSGAYSRTTQAGASMISPGVVWTMLTVIKEAAAGGGWNLRLVVDKVTRVSLPFPSAGLKSTQGGRFVLGAIRTNGAIFQASADFDDVRIYSHALSAAELDALYAEPHLPPYDYGTILRTVKPEGDVGALIGGPSFLALGTAPRVFAVRPLVARWDPSVERVRVYFTEELATVNRDPATWIVTPESGPGPALAVTGAQLLGEQVLLQLERAPVGGTYRVALSGGAVTGINEGTNEAGSLAFEGLDVNAPEVSNLSPAAGSAITKATPLSFDVTDPGSLGAVGGLGLVVVVVAFPALGIREVAWDPTGFAERYASSSSRVAIARGFRYTLKRSGGWPAAPTITAYAADTAGNVGA